MKIAYIEPYCTGSHAHWISGYQAASEHEVSVYPMEGVHWKWRMQGAAVHLASVLAEGPCPDLVLASDMVDLAQFLGLTRRGLAGVPVAVYFHENQISYPWSQRDRNRLLNQRYYGYVNYSTACAADRCFFNSLFHLEDFLEGVARLAKEVPDYREIVDPARIRGRCKVLPLGISLDQLAEHRESGQALFPDVQQPLLLWNHRWDHDKGPEEFFALCDWLMANDCDFGVIVCGQELDVPNPVFEAARDRLGNRIVHWGYAASSAEYARLLWRADVLPVTSRQDYFGISIAEAMYCETVPLLPERLAYPGVFARGENPEFFYRGTGTLREQTARLLAAPATRQALGVRASATVADYDWLVQAPRYDRVFSSLVQQASVLESEALPVVA